MKTRKGWTEEESRKFEAGLKKMGFKPIARDAEDFAQGTVSWSLKLGPVSGKELKKAARELKKAARKHKGGGK